jgi:glycosyltransferase involved in cell wall biosynthesis
VIVTTSRANQERFAPLGKPCYMFWPAVDPSFIGRPATLPHRLTGAAPRLGYVGFIMERTDLDLLMHVARNRPQWQLVLVGPQYPKGILERSGLLSLANVEYIALIPQAKLPTVLATLDVCLLPHRDSEYSRSMGCLKLYQYLASGRPIVATDLPALDPVREHVHIASTHDQFVVAIEGALEQDTPQKSAKRISAARENTWSLRVREIFDTVVSHLS